MPTPVVMPQMGESIAEGTIVRWMKKVGDTVDRDEPLFEISTDKVDAEVPSPAAGVLTAIMVKEGETVAVHAVVASIGEPGEAPAPEPEPTATAAPPPVPAPMSARTNGRHKSSPLVRRIAREHNVDISEIPGSGSGGRVTKHDILGYLGAPDVVPPPSRTQTGPGGGAAFPVHAPARPLPPGSDRVEVKPLSVMRKKIAEHMVLSRRTSAHVHTVFDVSFSAIDRIRLEKKDDYERLGARLTFMPFIARAVIDAVRAYPIVNASLDGDNVVYHKDVHLGVAVSLESGLIVPVIRNADEKNLLGLARAIADVAERARAKQLKPEDVQGGTFTITNPGQTGAQFGLPIINQPQVAILGVGAIEKRPVVVDDAIAIRTMCYLSLGFDHRLIDGAVANDFMAAVKRHLEQFDAGQV